MDELNLLKKYRNNSDEVNLIKKYSQPIKTNESLNQDNIDPMQLAAQQVKQQYPNMPKWLREAILSASPKEESPMLASASRGISNVTDVIPAAAGGLLQGASLPIRGIASFIPNEYAQRLANSPNLTQLFPKAEGLAPETAQLGGELVGAGGLLGKIFQGAKSASQLAKIPKTLQNPAALASTGAIATPGGANEKSIGALEALALGGAGKAASKIAEKSGTKLPEFIRGLTNKSSPELLVESVQKPHDVLQSTADELYGQVRNAIKKRDIKLPVKEENLNKAHEILGKTRANRKLIEAAKSGDYQSVHDLQSHLYKKGTKGLASDDLALERQGEEILDLRNMINEDLENQLLKEGHTDIAHVLKQGKKTYKQIMDTYYAPNLRKGIGKMVQSELRLVPENPEKLFTQNSVPMKNFLGKHPEAAKHTQGIKEKEEAKKKLNKFLFKTGVGGGTIAGVKSIYDLFK